jgi:hypothetical protein
MRGQQLELELWGELEAAEQGRHALALAALLAGLEGVLPTLSLAQQLAVAGEALERIVALWQLRAEGLLADWEARYVGVQLGEDWFERWRGPTAQFNLAAYEGKSAVTYRPRGRSVAGVGASRVETWTPQQAIAVLEQAEGLESKADVERLTGPEDPVAWSAAIARLLAQPGQTIALLELQRRVQMPLVEVVLGLLLAPQQVFRFEQHGDFYDTNAVWVVRASQ